MSAGIRAIDGESVHRIHSGQVVLDLQGALKELVENALDAGASSIEVRIRDNGLSSIEVVDNGSGIAEVDWPSIGLKHHTSKLPSLELLPSVSTFGFRGEALSALCALCEEVTVTTATKEMEPMGAVIKLGRDGKVIDNTGRVARPRGTTITLSGLFAPLPVRRKEFERNAKRELSKALTLLTAYALVPASTSATYDRSGVRLKVESTIGGNNGKGAKRSTLLSNDGRGDLRAAVVGVWGTKALEGVQEVDLGFEVPLDRMAQRVGQAGFKDTQSTQIPASRAVQQADGESEEENFKPAEACLLVKVTGLVSSASWGMGRSSADRQYFYINGRPVDAKPLQKALNEVYKSFNTHQVPLAVLDFRIPTDSIDINVSPDKRTILLHSEQNLLIAFRKALEGFFAPSRNSFAVNGATQTVRGLKMTQSTLALAGPSGTAAATGESAVGPGDGDNLRFADQGDDSAEPMQMDVDEATQSGNSRALGGSTHRTDPAVAGPSPFDLSSSRHAAQDAVPVESDTDSVVELERFDNSPVTRRPAQLLAPRSVPSRRTSNEPITVLDEEEEATGNGVPMGVRQSSEREPRSASARRLIPSAIPVPAIVGDKVEKSSVTVSTSSASWSPARKSASSQGRPQTSARASTTSAHAKTGKEARKSLRDRLAVYSQLPSRSGSSQAEQMRDNDEPADELGAGEEELKEREEEQDGQASTDINQVEVEEGEDELDELDEGEDVQMTATRTAARRKQSLPASPEILAIDADSDDDIPPGARGIGADVSGIENGQASDEERTKVRDDSPREDVGTTISQVPSRSRSNGHSGIASEVPLSRRYRDEIATQGSTGSMTVAFDFPAIQQRAAKRRRLMSALDASKAQRRVDLNARLAQAGVAAEAGIANRDLSSAEAALSRTVSKADFARMKVVGQFNKGFVIARCTSTAVNAKGTGEGEVGQDDLYIVDQHASDEKYNFETLQRETRIKAQKLIKPRSLQLTAADEIVAIENLDILKANGFEVDIDEEMPPGRGERVKLVAMPVSKETVFDYRDLEQLLHLLSDSAHSATTSGSGQGQMVRCTKARAMFAMRACRKSIMIGKSLTKPQMTQLLRNMGTIEQPWNCPHGRPTMRHLTAIDGSTAVTGRQEIDWSRWASEQDQ